MWRFGTFSALSLLDVGFCPSGVNLCAAHQEEERKLVEVRLLHSDFMIFDSFADSSSPV